MSRVQWPTARPAFAWKCFFCLSCESVRSLHVLTRDQVWEDWVPSGKLKQNDVASTHVTCLQCRLCCSKMLCRRRHAYGRVVSSDTASCAPGKDVTVSGGTDRDSGKKLFAGTALSERQQKSEATRHHLNQHSISSPEELFQASNFQSLLEPQIGRRRCLFVVVHCFHKGNCRHITSSQSDQDAKIHLTDNVDTLTMFVAPLLKP